MRRPIEERNTRKLQRTGKGASYSITLPIEIVRQLEWREGQKLKVEKWGNGMIIRDWEAEE